MSNSNPNVSTRFVKGHKLGERKNGKKSVKTILKDIFKGQNLESFCFTAEQAETIKTKLLEEAAAGKEFAIKIIADKALVHTPPVKTYLMRADWRSLHTLSDITQALEDNTHLLREGELSVEDHRVLSESYERLFRMIKDKKIDELNVAVAEQEEKKQLNGIMH